MLIKIIGAVLVISATLSCGVKGVASLRYRVRCFEAVIGALEIMESEICTRLTPMREVLDMLSQQAPEAVRGLFARAAMGMEHLGKMSFSDIWDEAVKKSMEMELRRDEADALLELGLCLGKYDVSSQAESISRVKGRMERFLLRAEEEQKRDTKVKAFFGLAAGLFAVIILI